MQGHWIGATQTASHNTQVGPGTPHVGREKAIILLNHYSGHNQTVLDCPQI